MNCLFVCPIRPSVLLAGVASLLLCLAMCMPSSPLAGAVVAAAQVKVEYKRETVHHPEGGIVREILVHDGQAVHAGQALMVVADAREQAEARPAAAFEAPPSAPREAAAADPLSPGKAVFDGHRRALVEQGRLLQLQVQQADARAVSLQQQMDEARASATLSQEELAINDHLAQQGYVSRGRLIELQRNAADCQSRLGEVGSDLAQARQWAAELHARQAQLRLGEIEQRLRTPRDQVERRTVRAPVDGEVMFLHVSAVGAVIDPRVALLDIVPQHGKLLIEARIELRDIEHVRVGGAAGVRLLGAQTERGPLLPATMTAVSAGRVVPADIGKAWFDVTVEVDAQALQQQATGQHLRVGMPAELYVTRRSRTLFEYLANPLRWSFERALRESD